MDTPVFSPDLHSRQADRVRLSRLTKESVDQVRCSGCGQVHRFCYCSGLVPVENHVPVFLVMHTNEITLASNSGRPLGYSLTKLMLSVYGRDRTPFQRLGADGDLRRDFQPLLLFPHARAEVLTLDAKPRWSKPPLLVVLDASWRQAREMWTKSIDLRGLPCVMPPDLGPSEYLLRKEPEPGFVCTFEATQRALWALEPPTQRALVQKQLRQNFWHFQRKCLESRGQQARLPG